MEHVQYTLLTPVDLKYLKELRIVNTINPGDSSCRLIVALCGPDATRGVEVAFEGVRELDLRGLSGRLVVGPLKAHDLRDRQLENIKYKNERGNE
jgi:hypothetical protein